MKPQFFVGLITIVFLFTNVLSAVAGPTAPIQHLQAGVSSVPGMGMDLPAYHGERMLNDSEAQRLLENAKAFHDAELLRAADASQDCPTCAHESGGQAKGSGSSSGSGGSDWRVVFLARLALRTDYGSVGTSINPSETGVKRFNDDLKSIKSLYDSNQLTTAKLDEIFTAAGNSFNHSPEAAMAYVASMGKTLDVNYGDSYAGRFIPRIEQFGHIVSGDGGSTGQCSDIHFAMLKAYKKMVGPNAKAYLVNYQTANKLHHTDLVIEHAGKVNIINYGQRTQNSPGSGDLLAQNNSLPSHGLAYRIFTDDGEIDKMVLHVDSPLGKMLREVTTGRSSYNPFETNNYTTITAGLESGGVAVRTFFGQIDGGDAIMGVAVNLKGVTKLPAGFSLQSYLGLSLAYAHRTFRIDGARESLDSGILYINTGLGVVSPKLELKGFTLQARTDLVLEGGAWYKQFSTMDADDSRFEGDGNLISRTRVDVSIHPTRNFRIDAYAELELIPTFKTAFPSSTDGSSGTDGLWETLGVIPNRVTAGLDLTYRTSGGVDIFGGLTYQHTMLGGVGDIHGGVRYQGLEASAFLRGALDRDETPIFVPGAQRQVGFQAQACSSPNPLNPAACIGGSFSKSLEDPSWMGSLTVGARF